MANNLRSEIAKVIYDVWEDQGQPEIISAHDVLERYRGEIGDISPKLLGEELYLMEDDPGPIPFLRVKTQILGGEMGNLGLKHIDPNRLLSLATGTK